MNLRTTKKILALSFDVDHCFYSYDDNWLEKDKDPKAKQKKIIDDNKPFLDYLSEKINQGQYDKVILNYFSLRQDDETDKGNRSTGGTSAALLPVLQSYLQNKVKETTSIEIELFLMADIYGNPKNGGEKKAGESYQLILKERYQQKIPCTFPSDNKIHSIANSDKTKYSILYVQTHRHAVLNPNANIDYVAIDDSSFILETLKHSINAAPALLPKCNIELIQYAQKKHKTFFTSSGTGETDRQYPWSIRAFNFILPPNNQWPLTVEKLQELHLENQYCPVPIDLSKQIKYIPRFEKAREVCAELKSTLASTPNYTTAKILFEEKLIPAGFLTPDEKLTITKRSIFHNSRTKHITDTALEKPSQSSCLIA